jgi:hypothetical protein
MTKISEIITFAEAPNLQKLLQIIQVQAVFPTAGLKDNITITPGATGMALMPNKSLDDIDIAGKLKKCFITIQGVPKVLTRFCEAISREPMGLHKWHRRQKMRLILKFCLFLLKYRISI